jgi:hypothetical protein
MRYHHSAAVPLVLLALSCSVTPKAKAKPDDTPVEVWVPGYVTEPERKEIAKALEGHPPPSHDRIPPHTILRRVEIQTVDKVSWHYMVDLAMAHAKAVDADGIVFIDPTGADYDWRLGTCSLPGSFHLVRYTAK